MEQVVERLHTFFLQKLTFNFQVPVEIFPEMQPELSEERWKPAGYAQVPGGRLLRHAGQLDLIKYRKAILLVEIYERFSVCISKSKVFQNTVVYCFATTENLPTLLFLLKNLK